MANATLYRRCINAMLAVAGAMWVTLAAAQTVYHRCNDADPETLDPHKTSTVAEAHLLRDLGEGLTIHDGKGKLAPGAAESWQVSKDGKVYTFKLRANARWSNGDPVRAEDFVFSLRRIMNPETGAKYATVLYPILNAERINKKEGGRVEELGVRAVDERTVQITLERPTAYFLELLAHQTGIPVHPGSVQKHGKDFVKPGHWVSNGAYTLKEAVPGSHIRVDRNPRFHDAANVRIEQVRFYPCSDLAAAARRFQAGEVHSTGDIPADQVKILREKLGKQVHVSPYLGTYYLAVNTSKAPLSDARVRQALSMAIDREFLAEQIWSGLMLPAYAFVPPGIGTYGEPAYLAFKSQSPIERENRAKALLKSAGYGPGKPLKLEIRYNTTDNNRATAVAIGDMWKQIGVETSFINTDAKTHFAHLRDGGDFDVARAGWIADYSDPQNFLFLLESHNKGFNYARYANKEYDSLMKRAADVLDPNARRKVLFQAESLITRDQPFIPMLYYSNKNLISSKLEGFTPNLRGANATRFMTLKP